MEFISTELIAVLFIALTFLGYQEYKEYSRLKTMMSNYNEDDFTKFINQKNEFYDDLNIGRSLRENFLLRLIFKQMFNKQPTF